jgi:TPR repeat protein
MTRPRRPRSSHELKTVTPNLPSTGRPKICFAPFAPPLMANVRSLQMASMRSAVLLAPAVLASCASPAPEESAYNRGVAAYRANEFAVARAAWSESVASDNHSAENNLGYLLYEGLGGPTDRARAVELWRKAAEAGHSEAQWHLGQAFQDGDAVRQSNVEAYAWFRCSVTTAELPGGRAPDAEREIARDARRSLERLLGFLDKEQFERGELLAKQYISAYARRSPTEPRAAPNVSKPESGRKSQ